MWFYWALFLWPVVAAGVLARAGGRASRFTMLLFAGSLALVIGLRFHVGMDWDNYLDHLLDSQTLTRLETFQQFDPAYALLTWIAVTTGSGIWLVNLGCAIAFVSGLYMFCKPLPNPWLALVVALPYMAIVMAMNYTRQGAAFGVVLWALIALEHGQVRKFVILVALAACFHKPAAVLMPLGALSVNRNWVWVFLWVCIASILIYVLLLAEGQAAMLDNYFGQKMSSEGGGVRVAMNAIAAVLYLILRKHFEIDDARRSLWTRYALLTLLFIPAIMLTTSTTAVDRVALYFMPIQIIAFGYLPTVAKKRSLSTATVYLVASAYAIVLFVWFNYSPFAYAWLPYRFYPFEM